MCVVDAAARTWLLLPGKHGGATLFVAMVLEATLFAQMPPFPETAAREPGAAYRELPAEAGIFGE